MINNHLKNIEKTYRAKGKKLKEKQREKLMEFLLLLYDNPDFCKNDRLKITEIAKFLGVKNGNLTRSVGGKNGDGTSLNVPSTQKLQEYIDTLKNAFKYFGSYAFIYGKAIGNEEDLLFIGKLTLTNQEANLIIRQFSSSSSPYLYKGSIRERDNFLHITLFNDSIPDFVFFSIKLTTLRRAKVNTSFFLSKDGNDQLYVSPFVLFKMDQALNEIHDFCKKQQSILRKHFSNLKTTVFPHSGEKDNPWLRLKDLGYESNSSFYKELFPDP